MPILLSHNSALERLRAVPPQVDQATRTQASVQLSDTDPIGRELAALDPAALGIVQRPIHHVVSKPAKRTDRRDFKPHVCSLTSIPSGLLYDLGNNCYAAGPELAFIQMASHTSLVGAVVLGHELCGTYSHFFRFTSGFYERPALTTTQDINDAINKLDGMYNLAPARNALRWVRNGSASPMETVVACMLNLPTTLGGFGFEAPVLNYKVSCDAAARKITGTKDCKVDNAYPDVMCGVEFDGKEYHRDAEKDRRRREALAHLGWTIYVLNVDDLTSYEAIEAKVALLDKVKRQNGSEVSQDQGKSLLERLLKATRFGVGLNAALFGIEVPKGKVKVHL